jgi:hypothetical protein
MTVASQVGCRPSIEAVTGSLWPSSVAEGIISPTACDPVSVSILTKSEVSGMSTDVDVSETMLAQVWSTGASSVVFANLRFGQT